MATLSRIATQQPAAKRLIRGVAPPGRRTPVAGASAARLLQSRLGNAGSAALLARTDGDATVRRAAEPALADTAAGAPDLFRQGLLRPKLEVGAVDDPLEREADAAADRVMRMGNGACCASCAAGSGCEGEPVTLNRGPTASGALEATPETEAQVRRLTRGGEPLPEAVRARFEPRFGADFAGVRVHRDAEAAASAQALGARAWTLGSHVAFGAGHWSPGTAAGEHLIAHELAHTVQQDGPSTALLRQTIASPGLPGGPDPCLSLLEAIIELLNDVAKRFNDALDDIHDLFNQHRGLKDAHPEHGSWDGHRDRYNRERGDLRRKLAEWESNDDCRGYRLSRQQQEELTEAEEFGNKEFPERPARAMRQAQEEQGESVWDTLRRYLPAFLVAALIAAGAYAAGVALVACFASGACEIGLALAGLGALLVIGITAALRAAGVRDTSAGGPVAANDRPQDDSGQPPAAGDQPGGSDDQAA